MTALQDIRAFLESFCADSGLARDACLRTNVVLEELFTNCIRHGYGDESQQPVWISLSCDDAEIAITFEDNARPFNPFSHAPVGIDHTVRTRPVGGLGVLLAQKLVRSRDYAYVFGRNYSRLTLGRS
ncbi:MAG TPA: ATP-binding protein [Burkholderiales bacterium]|nr:ATP-binding protein [Burkholderiales bacterium]